MSSQSVNDVDAKHTAHVTSAVSTTPYVILLTGAPTAQALAWSDEQLTALLDPAFSDESSGQKLDRCDSIASHAQNTSPPLWRSIPLTPAALHTGDTQPTPQLQLVGDLVRENQAASFLSKASFTSQGEAEHPEATNIDEDSQYKSLDDHFLEHSLYLHDELPSSQLLLTNPSQHGSTSFVTTESFPSTTTCRSETSTQVALDADADASNKCLSFIQTTPLIEIPTATRLISIQPQTLTLNILVGIISVPIAPRQVFPRRWLSGPSRSLDLLEPVVGDPSRSGFTVSLWLGLTPPPDADREGAAHLRGPVAPTAEQLVRTTALSLRRGDVVLFRNLAMAEWQGQVFGQSLRRGLTTIEILYRSNGHAGGVFTARDLAAARLESYDGSTNNMLASTRIVRDWLSTILPQNALGRQEGPQALWRRNDTPAIHTHTESTAVDYRTLPPDTPV